MQLAPSKKPIRLSEPLKIIHTAWQQAGATGQVPLRHRLDPRDLKGHVDKTFILEERSPDEFRIRVAGQAVSNQIGMEIRGMPAVSMYDLGDRQTVTPLLRMLCDQQMIALLTVTGVACGTPGSVILLPMADDDGAITRILGAVDMRSQAIPPNRFAIADVATAPIAQNLEAEPAPVQQTELQSFQVVHGGRPAGAPKSRRRASLSIVR